MIIFQIIFPSFLISSFGYPGLPHFGTWDFAHHSTRKQISVASLSQWAALHTTSLRPTALPWLPATHQGGDFPMVRTTPPRLHFCDMSTYVYMYTTYIHMILVYLHIYLHIHMAITFEPDTNACRLRKIRILPVPVHVSKGQTRSSPL